MGGVNENRVDCRIGRVKRRRQHLPALCNAQCRVRVVAGVAVAHLHNACVHRRLRLSSARLYRVAGGVGARAGIDCLSVSGAWLFIRIDVGVDVVGRKHLAVKRLRIGVGVLRRVGVGVRRARMMMRRRVHLLSHTTDAVCFRCRFCRCIRQSRPTTT